MPLTVAATSPDGRFPGVARPTSVDALADLLDELERRGQGYVEIHESETTWPMLAVGLAGSRAVVHLFDDADSVSLLAGDAPSSAETVDVPIMDELATFTGACVVPLDTARLVVGQFVRGSLSDALVWHRL